MAGPRLDLAPYTLNNLPYGVISTSSEPKPRCAVAIGKHAIDLAKYSRHGNLFGIESGQNFMFQQLFSEPALNDFAALSWPTRKAVRQQIQQDLQDGKVPPGCLVELQDVKHHLPMRMSGFSDFYTSLEHCQNVSVCRVSIRRANGSDVSSAPAR
jgi:fumarylacetoacetase